MPLFTVNVIILFVYISMIHSLTKTISGKFKLLNVELGRAVCFPFSKISTLTVHRTSPFVK